MSLYNVIYIYTFSVLFMDFDKKSKCVYSHKCSDISMQMHVADQIRKILILYSFFVTYSIYLKNLNDSAYRISFLSIDLLFQAPTDCQIYRANVKISWLPNLSKYWCGFVSNTIWTKFSIFKWIQSKLILNIGNFKGIKEKEKFESCFYLCNLLYFSSFSTK